MATQTDPGVEPRIPLTPERVIRAAVTLADESGIESVSMRKLGQELGVEAMSLYNHVANKEEILNGMADLVVSEIDLTPAGNGWKSALRHRILSAREVMARHPWASGVIESRTTISPPMMKYMDSVGGIFLDGGFSVDLLHHAMHTLGSRVLGFSQELFDDSDGLDESPEMAALMLQQMTEMYPAISAVIREITHDDDSVVGAGCDDDIEFVFALDLILDGLERLRDNA